MRKHLGLNYSFGLNLEYHIDSARVGNETRFINHGAADKANATALSVLLWHDVCSLLSLIAYLEKLVFGDLRIAFYACTSRLSGCFYFSRLTGHNPTDVVRQIRPNEEILFDYGKDYWKGEGKESALVT
jgi:hypothetical protein